jgi:beta-lactamase class D
MTTFYFTFVYSQPYERLIPKEGPAHDPYFPPSQADCNKALIAYRTGIGAFVDEYTTQWNEELARIRGGATGSPPSYAEHQAGQWPRSIEI